MTDFTIGGLPLHPLLVHAVVVLVPLLAIAVILHAAWPAVGRRLGIVTPLLGVVLVVLVPVTVSAGEALQGVVGSSPALDVHAMLGRQLLPWVVAMSVLGLVEWVWFGFAAPRLPRRVPRWVRPVVRSVIVMAAVVIAAGTTVLLVLIGDAGARAVWGGLFGV